MTLENQVSDNSEFCYIESPITKIKPKYNCYMLPGVKICYTIIVFRTKYILRSRNFKAAISGDMQESGSCDLG